MNLEPLDEVSTEPHSLEKVSILIVDDRPDKGFALEVALTQLNENIVRVSSGAEALRALLQRDFAVILLDVKMPGMDGFETAAMIRQRKRSELTPIIFVSAANDTENHLSRGYSLGAVDYILAPVEPEILRAKVSVFVDLFRMTAQIRKQGEERAQRIRAEAARAEAEAARERSSFLADASRLLNSSLEIGETCSALARLAVPRLADCCVVDLVEETGALEAVTVAHRDPAIEAKFREYRRRFPRDEQHGEGPWSVHQTGVTNVCREFTEEVARKLTKSEEQFSAIRELGVTSYVAVPLRARNRIFGTVGLISTSSTEFTANDVSLAEELAERAGLAFENATLYEDAQEARMEAERANLAKDQFLAMLSHELRTPLTPVLATIALLETDATCPPGIRDSLKMIHRNVSLEARLIDDLLDLTRISKGKLQLHLERIDAHALLRSAIDICGSEMEMKGISLELDLAATRHTLLADSARIQQVFWNLIKNAVKFTQDHGCITIQTFDGEDEWFHLVVSDNGAGIDEEVLPRIFDAFEQGTGARKGGLGLGLAISKALVDLHKGTIQAESAGAGKGARFEVAFPASRKVGTSPELADAGEKEKAARTSARVLLVEDHPDTLESMTLLLRMSGYSVTSAASIQSALEVSKDGFDILVSDMGLPDGTGVDLFLTLAKEGPVKGVALTGYGMEEDLRRTREAGFMEHLTKPVDISKLDEVLQRIAQTL